MTLFGAKPMALSSSMQAMPAAPAPLHHELGLRDVAAGQVERVDEARGGDDRRAVLVVMEDRNVHAARAGAAR